MPRDIVKDPRDNEFDRPGYDNLWRWFDLSRASFLTLPRVLMHEMPDAWQAKMAGLLEQYDAAWPNQPDIGTQVRAVRNGRLVPMPEVFTNYRRPRYGEIEQMKPESALASATPGGESGG